MRLHPPQDSHANTSGLESLCRPMLDFDVVLGKGDERARVSQTDNFPRIRLAALDKFTRISAGIPSTVHPYT